jgi:hypothetical protein
MSALAGSAFKGLAGLVKPAGKVGRGAKAIGLDFSDPMTALGVGVPTALFAGDILGQFGGAVKESFTGIDKDIKAEMQRRRYEAAQAMKARRLQQAMSDNMMRLAAVNPQLYNQLLVGRALPQGAVVLGGGRKTDFLESVAYQMATGGFGTPTDSPDAMKAIVDSY